MEVASQDRRPSLRQVRTSPGGRRHALIAGALAHLECGIQDVLRSGDHIVYIVAPRTCSHASLDPLLYFRGQYQELIYGRRSKERGGNR